MAFSLFHFSVPLVIWLGLLSRGQVAEGVSGTHAVGAWQGLRGS